MENSGSGVDSPIKSANDEDKSANDDDKSANDDDMW
jgi:hypothetical protein